MKLKPEDGIFFTKGEFYSTLKGNLISDGKYENSKIALYRAKMRYMSDLNDLYNAQDVIFLCEIFENQFQIMYEKNITTPEKLTQKVN